MSKRSWRLAAVLAAAACMMSAFAVPGTAASDAAAAAVAVKTEDILRRDENSYAQYLASYDGEYYTGGDIVAPVSAAALEGEGPSQAALYQERADVVVWDGASGAVTYTVSVPRSGLYRLRLTYCPMETAGGTLDIALTVNGETPFTDAGRLLLDVPYTIGTTFETDSRGNHIMPKQQKSLAWTEMSFSDPQGAVSGAYWFYLPAGECLLKIASQEGAFALGDLTLYGESGIPSYEEYIARYAQEPSHSETVYIEAEKPSAKSDAYILPQYNNGDPAASPSSPELMLLNTLGGDSWTMAGQWVEWTFTVEKTGLYILDFRARQNIKNGIESYRRMTIDGELLFHEMEQVGFPFKYGWYLNEAGGETPYRIYLEAGVTHTLRMEAVAGAYGEVAERILDVVYALNGIYRDIIIITGRTPDIYRDYDLDRNIPGLSDTLAQCRDILREQLDILVGLGNKGSETSTVEELLNQLDGFVQKPETIPERLTRFSSNISALSSWVYVLQDQPLELDYILLRGEDAPRPKAKAGFFRSLAYAFQSIYYSFVNSYNVVGDVYEGKESLTVWVGSGRDNAQTVKQLTDELFVTRYNIGVNVSLVQTGLTEAIIAGNGPDVALFLTSGDPVNLAARKAVYDLSEMEGFQDVYGRFYEETMTPYWYRDGVYGLPIVQNFNMMFYREDIFDKLGQEPPSTWDEMLDVMQVLQGKNLNVGIPDVFNTLLFQRGGGYYTEDMSRTRFEEDAAMEAFTIWNEMYTKYGAPISYDFFNRFRNGEMPLGIGTYYMANQLQVAAPELRGMWKMVPLPTTPDSETGTVFGGNGSESAMIVKSCKNVEAAWKYLSWFTETETMVRYAGEFESRVGPLGRIIPGNREALDLLSWSKEDKATLRDTFENLREAPVIPASYYVSRNITNASRRVIYYNEDPRHTFHIYNTIINNEIARKDAELAKYVR